MSNDNAGRTSRTTSGGAPMGSTVAIVVTAVALVLGFLILRNVNDDSSDGGSGDGGTEQTSTTGLDTSTTAAADTTTSTTLVLTGTKVQVANASTQGGVAGQMSTALAGEGFEMTDATNTSNDLKVNPSKVIYDANDPAAKAVAESVAIVLGNIVFEAAPTPPPVESGAFAEGSGVILLLGDDLAGKTIDQINQVPTTGTTLPAGVTTTT